MNLRLIPQQCSYGTDRPEGGPINDESSNNSITALGARQKEILEYAHTHGEVLVEPLAEAFDVTPQTIRRDLKQLCDMQLLQRVHGGAILKDGVANMGYEARRALAAEEKQRIARCASQLISDDSSLFVNIGTTTEAVARQLTDRRGLLVVTNNLNVVNTFRHSEGIRVMTAGGQVRREDGGIVGESTTGFIARFKVDYAVIGVSALEPDGTLLDFDTREVRVAQAMIANSRQVILVADAIKFGRVAPVRIANISEIDYLVTDENPGQRFLDYCRENHVRVMIAEENGCLEL